MTPPKEYTGEILDIWNEVTTTLAGLHELKITDSEMIRVYCYHASQIRYITAKLITEPFLINSKGQPYPNPIKEFLDSHVSALRMLADVLGLSIKSRKLIQRAEHKAKGKKQGSAHSELMEFAIKPRGKK